MELIVGKERGCVHSGRPMVKRCLECGRELCYECAMELIVGSHVVASSSVDSVTQNDIGFFCPYCYLTGIYGGTKLPKKPLREIRNFCILVILFFVIFIPIGIGTGGVFVIILPIGFTAICTPIWIWFYISKKRAYAEFEKDNIKALKLLGVEVTKKTRKTWRDLS